jgi:type II secretory pathway component GspD/PulD (secretin)
LLIGAAAAGVPALPADSPYRHADVAIVTAPGGEALEAVLGALLRAIGAHPILHRIPTELIELQLDQPVPFHTLWPILLELHALEARWFEGGVVVVMPLGPPPPPPAPAPRWQRLVQLDHARASEAAALLNAAEQVLADAPASILAEPTGNLLLVTADTEGHRRIDELLAELDAPPARITVSLWLLELSIQTLEQRGLEVAVDLPGGLTLATGANPRVGWSTTALLPGLSIEANLLNHLRAAHTERLEQAQVTVAGGEEARLFVGGRFNLVLSNDESEVVAVPYGFDLVFTPRLLNDGRIRLALHAQVDDLIDRSDLNIGSRSLASSAILQPGELLLLGGLRSRGFDNQLQEAPGLAEMPLLGGLFRRRSEREQSRDLLLLVHVEIASGP